jgi:hypothetical protein
MKEDAKPVLIILTDANCSLFGRTTSGMLESTIYNLHSTDTKIITIDLGDENKT